ncbi:MAG: hypothetical protein FWG12_04555 [Holophagaceae bacterium]|nr:hypothetical protein [Holophagaceae bacterium]
MKAHKLLCAGAAFAMLSAHAQAQEEGFFGGLKLRGALQLLPKEDNLRQHYLGLGYEVGYNFSFGKMSAELGILYKPGIQEVADLTRMQVSQGANPIDLAWSADSRKNQLDGLTFRVVYEMPMDKFSLRGGLQFGALKFRQEYVADITDARENPTYRDNYNGVHDVGGLTISPFVGITFPVMKDNFVEVNLVGLNYKAVDYVHVAGTGGVSTVQNANTTRDYIKETSNLLPHIEVAFGFRF